MSRTTIGSDQVKDDSIVNADISSSAAIDGAKILANFGAQNLIVDTNVLYVDSTANTVGITNVSPLYPLHVTGSSNTGAYLQGTGASDYAVFVKASNNGNGYGLAVLAGNGTSNTLDILSLADKDNNPKVSFKNNGRIGVATTSPSSKIHIAGNNLNDATSGLRLEGAYPWTYYYDTEASQASWITYVDGGNYYFRTIPFADKDAADFTAVGSNPAYITPSGTIFSTTFSGALSGNATTATTATNLASGASGSIPYQTGSGSTSMLPAGTNTYVLTMSAGLPTWAAPSAASAIAVVDEVTTLTTAVTKLTFTGAGVTATEPVADEITITIPGGATPSGSDTWVQYNAGGSALGAEADFAYDYTNNRLLIGSPTNTNMMLQVNSGASNSQVASFMAEGNTLAQIKVGRDTTGTTALVLSWDNTNTVAQCTVNGEAITAGWNLKRAGASDVRFGLGTASPAYKLDVVGDTNTTGAFRVGGTALIGGSSGYVLFNNGSLAGGDSAFQWNNTTKKLGVGGAASSQDKMYVSGGSIRINGTTSDFAPSGGPHGVVLDFIDASAAGRIGSFKFGGSSTLTLYSMLSNSTYTSIECAGPNVGINKSGATKNLDVSGNGAFTTSLNVATSSGNLVVGSSGAGARKLDVVGDMTVSSTVYAAKTGTLSAVVGTSTGTAFTAVNGKVNINADYATDVLQALMRMNFIYTGGNEGGQMWFTRGRGTGVSPTAVQTGDWLGEIVFGGWANSGSNIVAGCSIRPTVPNTWDFSTPSTINCNINFNTMSANSYSIRHRISHEGSYDVVPVGTAPATDGSFGRFYVKSSDGKAYFKSTAGTEYDLTATGGSGGPSWTKYTVTTADAPFNTAATTDSVTLFTPAANQVIHGVRIKHSTAFSGGGATSTTVSVGISGNTTKYASAFDVFQAVAYGTYQLSSVFGGEDGATAVTLTATSDVNLSTLTAGSVDVWVLSSTTT